MAGGIFATIVGGLIPGLPSIAETARIIVDRLVPDPEARDAAAQALEKIISDREVKIAEAVAAEGKAQAEINLAEAQGNDRFSSRWRPAMGWVCVLGFAYNFVVAPIIIWITVVLGAMLGAAIPVPPTLDATTMMPVLLGMLGLGAQRTYERVSGVSTAAPAGMVIKQR